MPALMVIKHRAPNGALRQVDLEAGVERETLS